MRFLLLSAIGKNGIWCEDGKRVYQLIIYFKTICTIQSGINSVFWFLLALYVKIQN